MKAIKRISALLLAVVMVVAMVPAASASALSWEEEYSKYDLVFSAGAGNGGSDTWTYLLDEPADLPDALAAGRKIRVPGDGDARAAAFSRVRQPEPS